MYEDYEPPRINGYYSSPTTGYNYSNLYLYEKYFFNEQFVHDMRALIANYRHVGTIVAIVYVIVIFAIKHLMTNRERFDLRVPLIAWNVFLAVFSIFGTMRTLPEILYVFRTHGLEYTLCNKDDFLYGVGGFWSLMFALSKFIELVDTLFIVLRKRPLIFLHWYHHATILAYCYYWYPEAPSSGRIFGGMNYFIHSIMYTYYSIMAMKIQLPKFLSKVITTLQITQMIVGLSICFYVTYKNYVVVNGNVCHTSFENLRQSYIMYLSYFILFLHFFIQAYVFKSKKGATSSAAAKKTE